MGEAIGVAISLLLVQLVMQVPAYLYLIRPLVGSCAHDYGKAIVKPLALASLMGAGRKPKRGR